ncbi:MAG: N4-gp56 family major capsid protein [Actinobacteria bacterium]|nr:N4-gp56 family major capsid protein [Actinomycetota bacterium]
MAITTPANVDSSIPELWAKLTLRDHLRAGFWYGLTGPEGSRSAVIRREDLVNQPGDTIHIQITNPLAGTGVVGDVATLEGNEEALLSSAKKVIPEFYRHGVRWYRRANKKSLLDLRGEARMRLGEWGGEKMDDIRFANFVQQTTMNGETYTSNVFSVGGGTTPGVVGTTDTLDVESLQRIKLALYNNRALPMRSDMGEDVFAMVVHPNTLYNLKRSAEYIDWVREAAEKGKSNPFFRGAVAMVDGMLLFQHNNVPVASDGETGIAVSRNIAFGAEAFIEGVDENPDWAEDSFDYGNNFGIAYSFGFQPRRALEKNSLLVYAAAVTP